MMPASIQSSACHVESDASTGSFDAERHVVYKAPVQTISMKDLGFNEKTGISPVAVSQPFPLFSSDAVRQMRSEVLADGVRENFSVGSDLGACALRGYAAEHAPFVYQAWTDPRVLEIVSEVAGVDLVPCMDLEIGHINIAVKSEAQRLQELGLSDGGATAAQSDEKAVVGWHQDSYPFVCIVMLSDCTDMVGGETALRTGTGEIMKIRGPEMGCAVVLQGRYIYHQALKAIGTRERITMVTSFRPKDAHLPDDVKLDTIRAIADLGVLYHQFGLYRLQIIQARVQDKLQELAKAKSCGKKFDTDAFKEFLSAQIGFLAHTNKKIVENDKVIPGRVEAIHFDEVALAVRSPPASAYV